MISEENKTSTNLEGASVSELLSKLCKEEVIFSGSYHAKDKRPRLLVIKLYLISGPITRNPEGEEEDLKE